MFILCLSKQTRQETLFRNLVEVNVPFINTVTAGKSEVEVRFILKQSATIDIICLMNMSGVQVTPRANGAQRLTDSPEVKDVHLEKISNGLYPENFSALHVALGIQSSIAQCILKKNGYDYTQTYMTLLQLWNTESHRTFEDLDQVLVKSKAGGLRSTYKQEQKLTDSPEVKDVHLEKISNGLYPEIFSALHVALGIQSSIAQCILKKNGNDYTQTYMTLLQLWNTESHRTLADLDKVLVESNAGGLRSTYK